MEAEEIESLVARLQKVDPSLTKLQLNHACLGGAQTARILSEINANANLVELQLRQNYLGSEGMTAVIEAISKLRQLRAIDLRANHLTSAEFKRLYTALLQNFTLEDVRVDEDLGDADEVPFQIVTGAEAAEAGLTWSTFSKPDLVLVRNKIHEILTSNRRISECIRSKGTELKLRNRALERVPDMVFLPHLKILDLRNNAIGALPLLGLDRMVSLEELLLDYNRIKVLPRSVCNLGKLRVLSLRKNQISDIPKSIACMVSLREIKISGNELFEVPVVLATIPNLQRIELEDNPFLKRHPKFPIASDQALPFLREELRTRGLPKNLRMRLFVVGADGVGKSALIRALQPAESADKKKKKRTNTAPSNTSAPSFFTSRATIEASSDLKGTRLSDATPPSSTVLGSNSSQSATTSSSDDGLTPPPALQALLSTPSTNTANNNKETAYQPSKAHLELSQTLLPSSVLGQSQSQPTVDDLLLNVWEFRGQDASGMAHQFFVGDQQTAYVIVFNLLQPAESQSYIEHWLHSIYERAKEAPIILVGTHADDKRCNKDFIESTFRSILARTDAETRYPNLKFLYDIDTSTSYSLKALRRTLFELAIADGDAQPPPADAAATVPSQTLAIKVPESWVTLEERICAAGEQAGPNQAKREEFFSNLLRRASGAKPPLVDIVTNLGTHLQGANQTVLSTLKEAVAMDINEKDHATLISYLNAAGAISSLKDTGHVVLNPQWLLDAVNVLFGWKPPAGSAAAKSKTGFVQFSEITGSIWSEPKFPASEHQWLLDLFVKYEMFISVDKKTAFVPWMLPTTPPANFFTIWETGDDDITEQRRYYVFNYVPTATWFKLLSKVLALADWETQVHWRYGVVIQDPRHTAQAFISLDLETKMVKLLVRGRQQVLKMVAIAEAIELIMTEAAPNKKAKYNTVVPCRHCIQEGREADASLYPVSVLEAAVNKSPANALVNCMTGRKPKVVRVDWLAPDVALSSFLGERIEFKDIELGDIIGEGGYATVYKGVWHGNQVAVKQVKLVNIVNNESDNVFAEFRREVQLMAGLQNENLVVLKAICMEPFCMVLEFMDKGSLYEFTHSPDYASITWPSRVHLALDIARGMRFLHGMMPPIVHRDLKSPNILLTINPEDGRLRAKVADFGLSRSLDFSRELDGAMLEGNNPVWLAPEILLQQNYNEKVDVYSFGLILFEMLSGEDYFGNVTFMSDIENMVVAGERPPIKTLADDPFEVQSAYVDLLKTCWDPSPTERPTFAEICGVLTSLLKKIGVEVEEEPVPAVPAPDDNTAASGSTADTSSSAEDNGETTEKGPKRDMIAEYKSQKASRGELTIGDDDSIPPDSPSPATAPTPSSLAASPEPATMTSRESRRSVRKEKSTKNDSKSHSPVSSTGGLTSPADSVDRSKRASEKKVRHRRDTSKEKESHETESSDDSTESSNASVSSNKSPRPHSKSSIPALGAPSNVLSAGVRMQLSPRSERNLKQEPQQQ